MCESALLKTPPGRVIYAGEQKISAMRMMTAPTTTSRPEMSASRLLTLNWSCIARLAFHLSLHVRGGQLTLATVG